MSNHSHYRIIGALAIVGGALIFPTFADTDQDNNPLSPNTPNVISPMDLEQRALVLAARQDELSMRIQDLSWKWASREIFTFLEDIDVALLDARDLLEDSNVGGETIAAQNDAIEKIYLAAKKNEQQSGESGSSPMGAMMDQLDYMTGKASGKGKKGKDGKGGDTAGEGGGSGAETDASLPSGESTHKMVDERTVPKGGGVAPSMIPSEFRDGMQALRNELAAMDE